MSLPVLIIGQSGSGKTYSLKNFKPGEVGIVSVEKGRLPFRTELKVVRLPKYEQSADINSYAQANAAKYAWLENLIAKADARAVVIDDSQYLMANELFDRSGEKSYDKFTDIAKNFRNLIHFVNELDQDDKIVYFLHHTETAPDGKEKCKTIGKMLDEKLCIEGCFDIVLFCQDHEFYTQSNGISTAKSPEDMFPPKMPNDLKAVDATIREYYGMGGD